MHASRNVGQGVNMWDAWKVLEIRERWSRQLGILTENKKRTEAVRTVGVMGSVFCGWSFAPLPLWSVLQVFCNMLLNFFFCCCWLRLHDCVYRIRNHMWKVTMTLPLPVVMSFLHLTSTIYKMLSPTTGRQLAFIFGNGVNVLPIKQVKVAEWMNFNGSSLGKQAHYQAKQSGRTTDWAVGSY